MSIRYPSTKMMQH